MSTFHPRITRLKLGLGPVLFAAVCTAALACTATPGGDGNTDADGGTATPLAADGSTVTPLTDGGTGVAKDSSTGGGGTPGAGHLAYVSGNCGTGYTKVGTMYGQTVCMNPENATAVIASGETCEDGTRVGDYSGPYYKSVCKCAGIMGTAQFVSCPNNLRYLEPSANGTRTCGKADTQLFWSDKPCPAGFRNAGAGLGTGHVCRRDRAGVLLYLKGACPSGWENLGGNYCATPQQLLVGGFDASCPAGWDTLGDVGNNIVMCAKR